MDIFDKQDNKVRRGSKSRVSRQSHSSEMYVRLVLPAEEVSAIAKSILDMQSKPEVTLIDVELQQMKKVSKKRKYRDFQLNSDVKNRENKKSRQESPSTEKLSKQNSDTPK